MVAKILSFFREMKRKKLIIDKRSDFFKNAVIVATSSELFCIVSSVTILVLAHTYSLNTLKPLMVIWLLLSFIKLLYLERIYNKRDRKDATFYLSFNIISFLFAQGFWLTPLLSMIPAYLFLKKLK